MNPPTRRTASAGVALVATILFVAPVWAAAPAGVGGGGGGNGNGGGNGGANEGSVRVVDAVSGLESLTDNEPHVCTFLLAFEGSASGESGDWSIVDWPPTGSGAEIASGEYAIPANGSFVTGTFQLDAGHYRVQWQAINAQSEKHKTFWVDDDCLADEPEDQPEGQPEEQDQPVEDPIDEPTGEPAEEPGEGVADGVEEPAGEPEDEPGEGDVDTAAGEPPAPTDEQDQPVEELNEEPPGEPAGEPEGDVDGTVGEPAGEPTEQTAAEDQAIDEPETDRDVAPSVGGPIVSELPDTAMPMPVLPGLGAALGLLCLVAVHMTLLDRELRVRR